MARQAGTFVENQFIQGLNTEATGLNFPEKAVIESWNCRYEKNGEVLRRLGYDAEVFHTSVTGDFQEGVSRSFIWKNPGKTDGDFLVQQSGSYINFFKIDANGNYHTGKRNFSIYLVDYSVSGNENSIRRAPAGFAYAEGNLFIAHPNCDPMYVSYAGNNITVTPITIRIRDFDGLDDDLDPDERVPVADITPEHLYNLYNQSWYPHDIQIGEDATQEPLEWFLNYRDSYPANNEVWWYYKGVNSKGRETAQFRLIDSLELGNTLGPRGHYIYDAFNIDRSDVSGIPDLPVEKTDDRPSSIAVFAGRIWYTGTDDKVFYSQIIENESTYGNCYQKNDPCSEDFSDLLDTDGGVIKILGLGKGTALFSSNNTLFVFSNNGVWAISGSGAEGTGFVATDFSVRRLTTVSLLSNISLLDVEGTPIWWNLEGIWTATSSPQGLEIKNISNASINTFLDENIPIGNRPYVQGAFNPTTRTIQWLFKSGAAQGINFYKYDRILELNTVTGAFYPMKWDIDDCIFSSIFSTTSTNREDRVLEPVEDSAREDVYDSSYDTVTGYGDTNLDFYRTNFKYVSLEDDELNFLEERDSTYYDFATKYELTGAKDYSSYFISGAKVHGEGRDGTIEYLTVFAKTLPRNSCKMQTRWDWGSSGDSGKWTGFQEVYSANRDNRDVSRKRLLVRGSGPAIQLMFKSVEGKPFSVIGWSSFETQDGTP